MTDESLAEYIATYGDRYVIRERCKGLKRAKNKASLTEHLQNIQAEEQRKRKQKDKDGASSSSKKIKPGRPKKSTRIVYFGWIKSDETSSTLKKRTLGGGSVKKQVDILAKKKDLMKIAIDTFIKEEDKEDYYFDLVDLHDKPLEEEWSVFF